jgi:hypothetical protein
MNKIVLLAIAFLFAGCGSFSGKAIATSVKLPNGPHYASTVTVKVDTFTEKTNYSIDVDPKPVKAGIETTLIQNSVFKEVNSNGDYTLAVAIRRVDMRPAGLTARYSAVADWSLTPRGSTQKIWQERITSTDSANMGDAFGGAKRTNLALTWTFSRNIEEAITKLEASNVLPKP